MDEIKNKLIEVYGKDNFDRFIVSLLEFPSPEIVELAVLNALFNKIKKKIEPNPMGSSETTELLLPQSHLFETIGNVNIDMPKIVLAEDVRTEVNSLVEEALLILKNGFDYQNKQSIYNGLFKDYCNRFNRIKEGINN